MSRSLLIIEPNPDGHRMQYVRRIIAGARERGVSTTLATSEASKAHIAFGPLVAEAGSSLHVVFNSFPQWTGKGSLRFQLHTLQTYQAIAKSLSAEEVLVPYGDTIDKAAALKGFADDSVHWSLILMRPQFHHSEMGVQTPGGRGERLKRWFFLRLMTRRHLRALFTIDEILSPYLAKNRILGSEKVVYLPDPVDTKLPIAPEVAKQALRLSPTSPILLLFGAMDMRKGVADAVEALACQQDSNIHLLMAGRQNDEVRAVMKSASAQRLRNQNRLTEIDTYVDEETEQAVFSAADAVWIGYRNFYGSSGVLYQAGRAGLPIIACQEGLIGYQSREYNLGRCLNERTPSAIAEVVESVIRSTPNQRKMWAESGRALALRHNTSSFNDKLFAALLS